MIRKIAFTWETVHRLEHTETVRAKVYAGWLVHTLISDRNQVSSSSVFVSDPEHQWVITNLPKSDFEEVKA